MSRSESKFYNTAQKMDEAMIKLLDDNTFEEITVTDICKTAGINRSTFYSHYQNTYDLLKETKKHIMDNFYKIFKEKGIDNEDYTKANTENLYFITPKYLVPYLSYIKGNKKLFKTCLFHLSDFDVKETYDFLFTTVIKPIFERFGVHDQSIMRYMSKFYLSGTTAIVNEWVNNDCKDDLLFIVEMITMCIRTIK